MTTFGTYTPFLPFTLGRAVFQFDKAFHESRAVETSSLRGRKSIFLRARKRRETEISRCALLYIQYCGMRIFAFISMFLNYSWKSNQLFSLCLVYLSNRANNVCLHSLLWWKDEESGERWAVKKVTVGHETRFRI